MPVRAPSNFNSCLFDKFRCIGGMSLCAPRVIPSSKACIGWLLAWWGESTLVENQRNGAHRAPPITPRMLFVNIWRWHLNAFPRKRVENPLSVSNHYIGTIEHYGMYVAVSLQGNLAQMVKRCIDRASFRWLAPSRMHLLISRGIATPQKDNNELLMLFRD